MTFTTFLFYFLAVVMTIAAFRVITARSTVHAALYLVLAFATASSVCLWLRGVMLAILAFQLILVKLAWNKKSAKGAV